MSPLVRALPRVHVERQQIFCWLTVRRAHTKRSRLLIIVKGAIEKAIRTNEPVHSTAGLCRCQDSSPLG
jgi:hypothetical protein